MARNYSTQLSTAPIAFAPSVGGVKAPEVQVDFPSRIQESLTALNDAANTFEGDKDENGKSKTAQAIETAKLEHLRLLGEANAAKVRLDALVAQGSAADVYNASVSRSESALQKIVELLTKKTQNEILISWYGHLVSTDSISKDRRQDLRICKKIVDLKKFQVTSSFVRNASPEEVAKRADVIGTRLVELAAYISDQEKQAKQQAK